MTKLYNDTPFAVIIQNRLDQLGWSHSDLARRLQVTPSRIHNLMRQPSITETVYRKCLYVLGLSPEIREVSRPVAPSRPKKVSRKMLAEGAT